MFRICFATSYSTCRFLRTESVIYASNCSYNICGEYCPCVVVESCFIVSKINLAICSQFLNASNSGQRLIISLSEGLSSIALTIKEGHSLSIRDLDTVSYCNVILLNSGLFVKTFVA